MPNDYNQPPIPYLPSDYNPYIPYDSKKAKLGLIIGSLLSGGLSAAGGQNAGDAIVRGIAGGLGGLGQGTNFLQNWNTQAIQNDRTGSMIRNQMLQDELARKQYDMDVEQWQTMKPYYESLTQSRMSSREFNTPGDLDTFLASKAGRFGLDYSRPEDRAKMLTLFGRQGTGLSRQYNKWKPSLAPQIYNIAPGYQTPEGQPIPFSMRTGKLKPLPKSTEIQKTPSEADVKFTRDYTSATALIDELEKKFEENKNSLARTSTERITEYPARKFGQIFQTNPSLASLNSLRTATLPKLIRALGEVGTLTDMDIKRANESMPTTNDTEEVRTQKFQQLRGLMDEVFQRGQRQQNVIPGAGQITKQGTEQMQKSNYNLSELPDPSQHLGKRAESENGEIYISDGTTWHKIK